VIPKRQVASTIGAGLASGLLILGVGGRIAMRVVAYTASDPLRFTLGGTLQVVALGAAWGGLTGPILLLLARLPRSRRRWTGPLFGTIVLGLAVLIVGTVLGFEGRIVAPPAFIALSAVLFPLLFVLHGITTAWLTARGAE